MEIVGWIAVVIAALVALVAVALGVRSVPDAMRYMKIRRM
ncbi:hypothetical protein GGC64_000581 [Mycobacterium sp. OAS707]|jgi:hypothetical protein|nr:hypothetical protein [Mycobacterium sp. OAS707]